MKSRTFDGQLAPQYLDAPTENVSDWRPDFAQIRGNVAKAIADQIEEAIRSGQLRLGDKLPTQKAIADSLGFHPNTVYAAYREVARLGLTKGFARRGTFVVVQPLSTPDRLPSEQISAANVPGM
ncbi:GntR family transcriptional regulator [Burkholderia ubonensis]|uniref:GntR family transcriptional regulator n=1 Tax=Burkholderia ubonensis TaxID=101571 RepID=UPI0009B44035|nr:GntR family transcriptional regulator [Burkholderia ubonensis]